MQFCGKLSFLFAIQITIKTGKIKIEDISYEFGFENLMEANIIIRPDKLNNLFTVETYE